MPTIRVVDVIRTPGGRNAKTTTPEEDSGEFYRLSVLAPELTKAVASGDVLTVELDGVAGYPSSFLDEAFGGLIRSGDFTPDQVAQHLRVLAGNKIYAPYQLMVAKALERAKHCLYQSPSKTSGAGLGSSQSGNVDRSPVAA